MTDGRFAAHHGQALPRRHTVEVTRGDEPGNEETRAWSFGVARR
jgi:hypothetical protein